MANEPLRDAWDATTEGLETAVGSALTSWTAFNNNYVQPSMIKMAQCCPACCSCCLGGGRGRKKRRSPDMFFDFYDDNDLPGTHDELERLLTNHEASDDEYGSGQREDEPLLAESLEPSGSADRTGMPSTIARWSRQAAFWITTSMWGAAAESKTLKYQPSTAVLGSRRDRSSTKSSRGSHNDLFNGSDMEDAQLMPDNFAAGLRTPDSASGMTSLVTAPSGESIHDTLPHRHHSISSQSGSSPAKSFRSVDSGSNLSDRPALSRSRSSELQLSSSKAIKPSPLSRSLSRVDIDTSEPETQQQQQNRESG